MENLKVDDDKIKVGEHNFENKTERLSWLELLKGIGIILFAIGHIY